MINGCIYDYWFWQAAEVVYPPQGEPKAPQRIFFAQTL